MLGYRSSAGRVGAWPVSAHRSGEPPIAWVSRSRRRPPRRLHRQSDRAWQRGNTPMSRAAKRVAGFANTPAGGRISGRESVTARTIRIKSMTAGISVVYNITTTAPRRAGKRSQRSPHSSPSLQPTTVHECRDSWLWHLPSQYPTRRLPGTYRQLPEIRHHGGTPSSRSGSGVAEPGW